MIVLKRRYNVSNLVCMTRFQNNLHLVPSKTKYLKTN